MSQVDISKFPRILVIDDMLGTNKTYRESFCENNLLWDVTENDQEFITDEEKDKFNTKELLVDYNQ